MLRLHETLSESLYQVNQILADLTLTCRHASTRFKTFMHFWPPKFKLKLEWPVSNPEQRRPKQWEAGCEDCLPDHPPRMPHTSLMGPTPRFSAFGDPSFPLTSSVTILLLSISWLQKHYGSFPRFFFHSSILCLCGFYPVAFLWWVWKRWTACTNKIEAYRRHFQRSPFFLLPWILVSCVLGMVAEMYLFWAAGRPEFRDYSNFSNESLNS